MKMQRGKPPVPGGMAYMLKSLLGIDPAEISAVAMKLAKTAEDFDARMTRMETTLDAIHNAIIVNSDGLRPAGASAEKFGRNGTSPTFGGSLPAIGDGTDRVL